VQLLAATQMNSRNISHRAVVYLIKELSTDGSSQTDHVGSVLEEKFSAGNKGRHDVQKKWKT
jgi:hypothetical protein